jgi:hypothetical protein
MGTQDTPKESPDSQDTHSVDDSPLTVNGISAIRGETSVKSPAESASTADASDALGFNDLGIVDVPVADLPAPEDVNGPEDFNHHISWEDARSAAEQLPQIQKEMAEGKTADDFADEDAAAGLDWKEGKRRVYDLFYCETDPVRLDKVGDSYSILAGRHRIYAAKTVGLETIPAHVVEKKI